MNENYSLSFLQDLQKLSLERKILLTQSKIIEWYNHFDGDVFVSFSGGKDSTVLLDIARRVFPAMDAMFINTGLEYPEVVSFARSFANITEIKPKMRFYEVVKKYGYPIISKEVATKLYELKNTKSEKLRQRHLYGGANGSGRRIPTKWLFLQNAPFAIHSKCCRVMKKDPSAKFEKVSGKKSIIGTLASESQLRQSDWINKGCNAFTGRQISRPLSFWTEQDILSYIKKYNIPICSVYGDVVEDGGLSLSGHKRTGCMFCAFGCHLEKEPNRFQKMKETHPKIYNYCVNGGEYNEDNIWVPNKEGLGLGLVLDYINVKY